MQLTITTALDTGRVYVYFNDDHQASVPLLYGDDAFFYALCGDDWIDIPQWQGIEILDDLEAGSIMICVGELFTIGVSESGYDIVDLHGNQLEGAEFTSDSEKFTHTL